jgi:hypothetical protein
MQGRAGWVLVLYGAGALPGVLSCCLSLKSTQQPEPVIQADEAHADIIPDCADRTLNTGERDEMVMKVREALPRRKDAQARVDLLNHKSVPVNTRPGLYGGTWTMKNFKNNLKWIKKRIKEK